MKTKKIILKKVLFLIILLVLLQVSRFAFKSLIFAFVNRTLMADVIVNMVFMIIASVIGILILKKKKIDIDIFPKPFNAKYIIATVVVTLFMIITPIITKNYALYNILSLIYGAVVTVIYEELIFRGFVYKEISVISNEMIAYIASTVLFGIWHLGYIDTIIWRTSIFSPDANVPYIMLWKVIIGLIYGIILGFFRYKNKNVYSSILVHAFLNTFGS